MVLLLTGAIDIESFSIPNTVISNINVRLKQYLNSIEFALDEYNLISEIIFCENTNYEFDYSPLFEKAIKKGKKFEVVSFKGDYKTISEKGKGYGEGEIISFALKNSEILKKCDVFYKLSGRLIVTNMDRIVAATTTDNSFIYHPKRIYNNRVSHVETFFYKVSKDLYIKYLDNVYQFVNEEDHRYLEHLFYERLSDLDLKSFRYAPLISGLSGSSGESYTFGKKALILEKINYSIGVHHLRKTFVQKILSNLFSSFLQIRRLFK